MKEWRGEGVEVLRGGGVEVLGEGCEKSPRNNKSKKANSILIKNNKGGWKQELREYHNSP